MNIVAKSGIGLLIIASAFAIPYIDSIFIDFTQIPEMVLLLIQLSLVLLGLGWLSQDYE